MLYNKRWEEVMKYIIVKENNLESLCDAINKKIGEGYIPTGSLLKESSRVRKQIDDSSSEWTTVTTYAQPMLIVSDNFLINIIALVDSQGQFYRLNKRQKRG